MPELIQPRFIGGEFSVHFTPAAWQSATALSWSDFQRVQSALHELAAAQGWVQTGRFSTAAGREEIDPELAATIGDYRVAFEIDAEQRRLVVTAIAQR